MQKGKVYILTAVHNGLEDTKKLLKSVSIQTFKKFEVFLVDDGSMDGTTGFIYHNYPDVVVLKGNGNLWWTGSLNLGLKEILRKAHDNDFVWIINNDCYFPKNTVRNIYDFAVKHRGSIVGSLVLSSKTKKVWDNGVSINWEKMEFKSGGTDALSTKGTIYPVSVFKKIGLFDTKHFPHYFSDYEFSIRARRNGYKLMQFPGSRVYNRDERTGIGTVGKNSGIGQILMAMFSKKSKINLLLQFNIVRYVCPKKYRYKNYWLLITKMFRYPQKI